MGAGKTLVGVCGSVLCRRQFALAQMAIPSLADTDSVQTETCSLVRVSSLCPFDKTMNPATNRFPNTACKLAEKEDSKGLIDSCWDNHLHNSPLILRANTLLALR